MVVMDGDGREIALIKNKMSARSPIAPLYSCGKGIVDCPESSCVTNYTCLHDTANLAREPLMLNQDRHLIHRQTTVELSRL